MNPLYSVHKNELKLNLWVKIFFCLEWKWRAHWVLFKYKLVAGFRCLDVGLAYFSKSCISINSTNSMWPV